MRTNTPKAPRPGVARARPEAVPGTPGILAHMSEGNSKIGYLFNFSLPPIRACHHDAPCRVHHNCYALDSYSGGSSNVRKEVRPAYDENLLLMTKYRRATFRYIYTKVQDQVRRDSKYGRDTYFRWHVAGDILDQNYLDLMCHLARLLPTVHFLCFTKMFRLDYSRKPANLQIIYSMWPGWGSPKPGKRHAWLWDNSHDPRVPKNSFLCPGFCDNCGLCWRLDTTGKDVIFVKHYANEISDRMKAELEGVLVAKYGDLSARRFYPLGTVYGGPRPFVPKRWRAMAI